MTAERFFPVAVAVIMAMVAYGADASSWLVDDFEAVYDARVGIAKGQTRLSLRELGDDTWEVESVTRLTGFLSLFKRGEIRELSRFRFSEGGLRALSFVRDDSVSSEERDVRVDYDWESGIGYVEHQGERSQVSIDERTSNTLLMQIALMQDLTAGQRRDYYHVLGHKGLLRFNVSYEADVEIDTVNGREVGLRYTHERPDSGTRTTFWAAPGLAYLPARCEIVKDGKKRGTLELARFARPTLPES